MKIQKLFFCLVIVMFIGQAFVVKGQMNSSIISLSIDQSLEIEQVEITYSHAYFSSMHFGNEGLTFISKSVNGEFSFQLPYFEKDRFFKLRFIGKSKAHKSFKILSSFVFYGLPEMNVVIEKDTCIFKGKGRSIFEAQYRVKSLERQYLPESRLIRTKMNAEMKADTVNQAAIFYQFLVEYRDFNQRLLIAKNNLIENYEDLSIQEKGVLKLNARSEINYKFTDYLMFHSSVGVYSSNEQVRSAILQFYLNRCSDDNDLIIKDTNFVKSGSYIESLYVDAYAKLYLPLLVNSRLAKISFKDLFNRMTSKYKGFVLDRVLATTFYSYGMTKEVPNEYYEKALFVMKDVESRSIVQEFSDKRRIGAAGYNFTLVDTAGNNITFDSLKGKVVVMDFWFTGCHGCAVLTKAMHAVHEYFKENQDVVFVNVSIDRDWKQWLKSVRLGKYTHSMGINLYTAGAGDKHEVIQHYNIYAYPTLIVFDRGGKIASYNPKWPIRENEKRFIDMINEI